MSVIYIVQQKKGRERSRPVIGKEDLKYVLAMIMLDMLAPIFLLITLSCVLLSFDSAAPLRFSAGSLFVLLACICWGFENNCTSSLSEKDTRQIVIIKGLGSGMASLLLSFVIGEEICGIFSCCVVMILGFLAIGLSVYYYVLAQSEIGAARTSAYYAISPFIGVLLALLIFHELPGKLFWTALAIMAVGVYINVKDIQEQDEGFFVPGIRK